MLVKMDFNTALEKIERFTKNHDEPAYYAFLDSTTSLNNFISDVIATTEQTNINHSVIFIEDTPPSNPNKKAKQIKRRVKAAFTRPIGVHMFALDPISYQLTKDLFQQTLQ